MDKDLLYRFFEGRASVEEMRLVKEWSEAFEENSKLLRRERKLFNAIILSGRFESSDGQTTLRKKRNHFVREFLKIASVVAITVGITAALFSIGEGIIQEVDAIIDAWYPGMQGGNALADVLFGDYNPGGRLSISIPRSVGQLPVYYNPKRTGNRNKYLEEVGVPRYCFGYGLSYTSFEYSDMEVTLNETTDDCIVNIRVKIVNTGQKSGDEVVQLYICDDVSSYTTPAKQLRAFERIHLEAGESQIVTFTLNKKSMMLYMQDDEWVVEPGSFSLMIGSSSQDIRLQRKIYVTQKYCLK